MTFWQFRPIGTKLDYLMASLPAGGAYFMPVILSVAKNLV